MPSSGMCDLDSGIVEIASGPSRLRVSRTGGELLSATMSGDSAVDCASPAEGPTEFIAFGGDVWPHHAPVLFPAICRHPHDAISVNGRRHPLGHHGFLRDLELTVVSHTGAEVALCADSTAETRARYPFPFGMEIVYRAEITGFSVDFIVTNRGSEPMPYGLGWHPAFVRVDEDRPSVTWDATPTHVRRVRENLLTDTLHPVPCSEPTWPVDSVQFTSGGIISPVAETSSLLCRLGGGRNVELSWSGFDHLTLWSPPGGDEQGTFDRASSEQTQSLVDFLCLEPWRGLPAREDWSGDESDRTDLAHLSPGATATHSVRCVLSLTDPG